MNTSKKIISLLMCVLMVLTMVPMSVFNVGAVAATAITLTLSDGESIVVTDTANTSGTGYNFDAETATLTLNNWSGRRIYANGDLNLYLKGTNTITIDPTSPEGYGISNSKDTWNDLVITADADGVLNVSGTDINNYTTFGIEANTIIHNGTININMVGTHHMYGVYGSITFAANETREATLNVRVENTDDNNSVIAIGNGSLEIVDRPGKVIINAEAYSAGDQATACGDALDIRNSAPILTFTADNDGGEIYNCCAYDDYIYNLCFNEGGKMTCYGTVINGNVSYNTNKNTVVTTPANGAYMWRADKTINQYIKNYYLMDTTGVPLQESVIKYSETPLDLSYSGTGFFSIPETKVGIYLDNCYFKNYINGVSSYANDIVDYEIVEGSLPEGLVLNRYYGLINGTPTETCAAGTITIKATDTNGTPSDTSDDRSINFTVPYGACIEPDRFLTVGEDTPVEMRQNGSGTGWAYDAATKTLTLNGYNGKQIKAEDNLNLHLKGTNTITIDPTSENAFGISNSENTWNDLVITADEDGVLNISGTDINNYTTFGIEASTTIYNGTININMVGTHHMYGVYGSLIFAENETRPATLNVRVENTDDNNSVIAIGNGSLEIVDRPGKVIINAEAYSAGDQATACEEALEIRNSAPILTFTADNDGGEIQNRCAFDDVIYDLRLNDGGKITFYGTVIINDVNYKTDRNTVFTTPANGAYMWRADKTINQDIDDYYLMDTTGKPLQEAVIKYSETPLDLRYNGAGFLSIPETKMGDYILYYFKNYIVGASSYIHSYSEHLDFEIIEGTLPEGLEFNRSYGFIRGTVTKPCQAGSVTIRATDKNGTSSDTTDDRIVNFVVPYGAVKSNKPVTGITLDKDVLVLNQGGKGTVKATVNPADAPYPDVKADSSGYYNVNLETSTPVDGVTTITATAANTPGIYTVTVTSMDTGISKTFTVYVKEDAPTIEIDADDNLLRGFTPGVNYKISVDGMADYNFTAEGYNIELKPEWVGKTLTIVRTNAEAACNSDPCILGVAAKTVTAVNGSGSGTYAVGSVVNLTADAPATGYKFIGWTGTDGLSFQNSTDKNDTAISFIMPDSDIELTANYEKLKYTVSFSNAGYGTGEMASQTVEYGDYVLPDCTFTPKSGYAFSHWRIGFSSTANPGETVQITEDTTIYAIFVTDLVTKFNITVNGGEAKIAGVPATQAVQQTLVAITAEDKADKVFSHWQVSGGAVLTEANSPSTTFGMPYSDVEITAVYKTVSATLDNITFDTESEGYSNVQTKSIVFTNTGEADINDPRIEFLSGHSYFDIAYAYPDKLTSGESDNSYTISTRTGLSAGTYTAEIRLTGDEIDSEIKATVTFIVLPHVHAAEAVAGTPANCTNDGYKGYYACACGEYFEDEECTVKITDLDAWKEGDGKLPATGIHTGGTATCTQKAKCSVCGEAYGSVNKNNHKSITTLKAVAATCTKEGKTEGKKCTACGVTTVAQKAVAKKAHSYKTVTTKATLTKNGKTESKCSCGKVKSTQTIAKISSVTLSATKYIYDGKNKTPKVTVKDANGNKLVKNVDYKTSVASKRSGIGKYTVKVTFIGKYSGSKNVYFTILPGKPASVKSAAQTTSSVKLTWSKVSGAAGYTVYRYSPSKKAYVKAGTTEGTSLTVKGLLTGTKYTFKVVAYGKTSGGKVYNSEGYTLLKTATKTKTPELTKVTASSTKGKAYVYHGNVSGETGYTVYYSTSKTSGFKKYNNFKADTTRCDITKLTSGRTYYFKVRTYITTDSGYVYSPWSAVKGIKVK